MELQQIKQRFGIIGSSPLLNRAIDISTQIAPTDITVLIMGESGVGKEVFSGIIHQVSKRKHGPFIAVNCGAIPEGTIDSELFGHEKGAYTGAHDSRKGYFEVVNGGTIFLDEVADLPLATQARLLRVLESGEFIRVGSSKVQKTDVRVVAATNINLLEAVRRSKFREDLYYRLNSVPVFIPPLRERGEDIHLLFRKFISDASSKYNIPVVKLDDEAKVILLKYRWPGNVRQLKSIAEQICLLETKEIIDGETIKKYIPVEDGTNLPVLFSEHFKDKEITERDLLYKVLFDMKKDIFDLKKIIFDLVKNTSTSGVTDNDSSELIHKISRDVETSQDESIPAITKNTQGSTIEISKTTDNFQENNEEIEESLSLEDKEIELIIKSLVKHKGNRKLASMELGISERTLYRKIKDHGLK